MWKFAVVIVLLAAVAVPSVLFATQEQQGTEARINAYKHEDGRVEFAMQVREGDSWGERILPRGRYLGANARTGRWLSSTPIVLPTTGLLDSLPIRTPWMIMQDNPSLSICSGYFGCSLDPLRDMDGHFTTLVSIDGTPFHEQIKRAQMSITCYAGRTVGDHLGEVWVEGSFEGWLNLWTISPNNPSAYRWFNHDSDKGVVVLARQYSLLDEQEVVRENRFDLEGTRFDYDWLAQLEGYTDIWVQVWDQKGNREQVHFDISGMLATPMQLNLENCGTY